MTDQGCLDPQLQEPRRSLFLAGLLSSVALEEFEGHVLECEACCSAVEADLELETRLRHTSIALRRPSRELIRAAVCEYLSEAHPDRLAEFDLVYDDVFEAITTASQAEGTAAHALATALGSPAAVETPVTAACWDAAALVASALDDRSELAASLDSRVAALVEQGREPHRVERLRQEVERALRKA